MDQILTFLEPNFFPWRLLAAAAAGMILSLSGSLVQSITQNDLAGPSTLGINAFIVLFVIALHFASRLLALPLPLEWLSLILCCAVTVLLLFFFWRRNCGVAVRHSAFGQTNMDFLILVGLCFNLFVGALFSLFEFFFMSLNWEFPSELWYGNFRLSLMSNSLPLVIVAIFLWGAALKMAPRLQLMSFSSHLAENWGVNGKRVQLQAILLALLGQAFIINFFGVFSFAGLIFPHLLRSISFFQSEIKRELLWGSLLCGIIFLLLDFACTHILILGAEVPVGMLSSFLGTSFLFILLINRYRRRQQ